MTITIAITIATIGRLMKKVEITGSASALAREAGGSIKPGVERSGTPGSKRTSNSQPVERATAVSLESLASLTSRALD
jgi:hypothetical protein